MKCLKVEDYIKRTVSVEETRLLSQEFEVGITTKCLDFTCRFT